MIRMDSAHPRGGAGRPGAIRIPRLHLCAVVLLCLVISGCAPFALPVSTPTPTLSARTIPADRAILGGTEAAFTRQFGPPTTMQGVYRYVTPTNDVVIIALGMRHIFSGPLAGQVRVQLIYLSPEREWTPDEAEAVYRTFLPEDSVALGSTPQDGGTKYLYRSASLAATFTHSGLLDASGKDEPPGTFEVLCGRGIFVRGSDTYACLIHA